MWLRETDLLILVPDYFNELSLETKHFNRCLHTPSPYRRPSFVYPFLGLPLRSIWFTRCIRPSLNSLTNKSSNSWCRVRFSVYQLILYLPTEFGFRELRLLLVVLVRVWAHILSFLNRTRSVPFRFIAFLNSTLVALAVTSRSETRIRWKVPSWIAFAGLLASASVLSVWMMGLPMEWFENLCLRSSYFLLFWFDLNDSLARKSAWT